MKTNVLVLLAACTVLVSCKGMKGTIEVQEEMTLLRKKGKQQIKLAPGNYSAKLSASSKTKFKLKVNEIQPGQDKSFTFRVPKGTQIPEYQGELKVGKEHTGQPYGLDIAVATDVDSSHYDTTESCVAYYDKKRVCHWVPSKQVCQTKPGKTFCRTGKDGKQHCKTTAATKSCHTVPGHDSCHIKSIPVYGSQEVTYRVTRTTKDVIVSLVDGDIVKAKFDHQDVDRDRDRISSGACYR